MSCFPGRRATDDIGLFYSCPRLFKAETGLIVRLLCGLVNKITYLLLSAVSSSSAVIFGFNRADLRDDTLFSSEHRRRR